jgi:DNA-binding CsgD family transcriptional regulator
VRGVGVALLQALPRPEVELPDTSLRRAPGAGADESERVTAPLGRDGEFDQLLRVLDRLQVTSAGLLISGDAGIGKTTVLEAGLAEARARGYRVLSSRAGSAEAPLSFVGIGDLLDEIVAEVLPVLPPSQRRALTAALGLGQSETTPEARLLGFALLNSLRGLAVEQPVVVAVDDLQWLDTPSGELLVFAFRRVTDASVGLLATARGAVGAAAPFGLDRELASRLERLELGPLSLGALQRLLREQLAAPPSRPLLRRIHERSGGNPFYALELARALAERGEERLPESLRSLVADRIDRLPPEVIDLLVTLAAAAHPTLTLVHALGADAALDAAEKEGVVTVEGVRIRFAHPLLAAGAHDGATSGRRRAAHRRLVALVDDPEQRARHLALAAEGPDEETAAALDGAASSALARGAPGVAGELTEQALAMTPRDDHEAIRRRRLEAARRWRTVGNTKRQRVLLQEALADAREDREKAEPLWQLAALAGDEGDGRSARTLINEAIRSATGDDKLSAEMYLDAIWLERGLGGGLEQAQAALDHAKRSGDVTLEAEALSSFAHAAFSHGLGYRVDLFEEALELEKQARFIDAERRPITRYGLTAKWADDIPRSRELLERAAARALKDEDASAAIVLYFLSWLHLIAGEWERALERADESRQIALDAGRDGVAGGALLTRAIVEAHLGQLDEARVHLDQTRELAREAKSGLLDAYGVLWAWGVALVALSSGQPQVAVDELVPAVKRLQERGLEEPGYHPWFPTCVEALIQVGRVDDAETLTAWFEERAVRLQRRWALATCAHAGAAIAAARGDLDHAIQELERALQVHESVDRPFDRTCTLMLYGQTLRRAKRRRLARETLTEALSGFERLGAPLWADRARGELARIGGRAPSGGLTPTEGRIAALVAAGKSNKEVAAELFVTVRTVETNLSRIYAKLGLRSRGELAAWLARA